MLSRVADDFLIIWIPACEGMTQFCANSLLNLSPKHVYRNKGKALMVEAN